MTFGSLFSGIGGLDLGLERAGMKCLWQVEIDAYCHQVLEQHWPRVKRYDDIRTVTGDELESVDLICGGFPCQDLSQAGKRAGIQGPRSGLWFEFARLVGRLRPGWVLVENVPGLLVHDAMRRVIGDLARCGYVGCWRGLRAAEFGASHFRKRIFVVAHARCAGNWRAAEPSGLDWQRPSGHDCGTSGALALPDARGTGLPDSEQAGLPESWRRNERRTAAEFCGAFAPGPADPRWPGILNNRPDLAPALESPLRGVADGFPHWLDRAMRQRTKRLGRLGNAVVPQIAEWIGKRILEFEERDS